METGDFWRGVASTFLAIFLVACIVGSYVLAIVAGTAAGSARLRLMGLGALMAIPPFSWQAVRENRHRKRVAAANNLAFEYNARLTVALGEVFTPLTDLCGRILTADRQQRELIRGQLTQAVVVAAAQLCGPHEETRAVFFHLEDDALRPQTHAGRADRPQTTFIDNTDERGSAAHRLVRTRGFVYVPDVDEESRPEYRVSTNAPYKTFLSVAVSAGDRCIGLLSIDAVRAGSILPGAQRTATALAQLLAVGWLSADSSDSSCS